MTQSEFIKAMIVCLEEIKINKKTGKIEVKIDVNCGGIGRASILIAQDLSDFLRQENKKIAYRDTI